MLTIPIGFLLAHFIGDFLCQTDWMALNKSSSFKALGTHVSVYSIFFLPMGWKFFVFTWLTHFITDGLTSRATAALWQRNLRHWFFVMIGFDQLIHYTTLALTWKLSQ